MNLSLNQITARLGMTAIVMGDVNAVHTLDCAHRRQLLAARALHERSPLIKGFPFPRTKIIWHVSVDDLVILSVVQCSDVQRNSSPIDVQRADVLHDFLQMPTNACKSGSTLSGEFWGGRLDGVSGTLRFPFERRVLLVLVTMLNSAMGVNWTLLRRGVLSPSLSDEKYSPASMCPTLQPPHCRRADDVDWMVLCFMSFYLSKACSFQWDKLAGRALRNTPRCRRISKRRWRLLRLHCTGGLARFVRFWPRRKGSMFALIGKAKNNRATCTMYVQPLRRFLWIWSGPRCFPSVSSQASVPIYWNWKTWSGFSGALHVKE